MKFFIINLEKDKERYKHICNQLDSNNLKNYERIDAIYGKNVYDNYNTKLRPAELGCYLSFQKACHAIIKQDLEYGIVLEDDITLTEWASKLEEIIKTIPTSFDVCWIGNSRAKWPRNTCNLIPDYDYEKLSKYKINDFVYKIEDVSGSNYPIGGYGLVVSKKGAMKILSETNNYKDPIDEYLVKNLKLEKYMTIPSIVIHCYDFGSNISITPVDLKQNPFENIWKKNKTQEFEALNILEQVTKLFSMNNINYSLMYGTLIGYGRDKKFIGYDDDIDVIVNINDIDKIENLILNLKTFCNVYKYKKPIINKSLYYKLYPIQKYSKIKSYEYGWPFIDIFVYEKRNNGLYFPSEKKYIKMNEEFSFDILKSHNNENVYKVQVFKDYKNILDKMYKKWNCNCISSQWNHREEKNIPFTYEFNCSNVIPGYKSECKETHYKSNININWILYYTVYLLFFVFLIKFVYSNFPK